ncbi:PAS domain-containing protein, partial [Pseudomonas aeruginosa]
QQWEATFDAITHPLCITTEAGDILRTNRAFSKATNFHYRDLIGKNALASFFKDPSLEKKPMTLPFHERISLQGQKTFE